jgi:tRNA(adenine34) deaminase
MDPPAKRTPNRNKAARKKSQAPKKWSQDVKTVSTFPPEGTFTKDAETVARIMARRKVSPKGLGSAIRMVQFFINRAGKDLPAGRRRELEKAKQILREKLRKQRGKKQRPPR